MARPRSSALLTMPRAMVCSESRSTAAARASASSGVTPSRVVISTTRNSPRVSVPVLSKNTAVTLRASSSPRRSRTSRPWRAPSVVEIATTSGMARPSACGQAITSTVTTRSITNAAGRPASDQPTSVAAAATTATTVSRSAARSASACAREREVCASATSRMMPASAVFSPVPVTSTRRDPAPFTVPAITRAAGRLADRPGLAGDHRLVHVAVALADHAVGGHAGAGAHEHEVALAQVGDAHGLDAPLRDPLGGVGEQPGQLLQRALGLGDRAHLDPVAEHHDGDQGGQLPPEIGAREAERHREAEHERDRDGQRDERHHAGPAIGQLAGGAPDEHPAAVGEDERAEHGGDPARRGRAAPRLVAEPVLDHRRPDDGGDRQQERAPELAAEHLHRVPRVPVVAGVRAGRAVTRVCPVARVSVVPGMSATAGVRRRRGGRAGGGRGVVVMPGVRIGHGPIVAHAAGVDGPCDPGRRADVAIAGAPDVLLARCAEELVGEATRPRTLGVAFRSS